MARFMVERTFADGLDIPVSAEGAAAVRGVVDRNAEVGVTWVHSYVSPDKTKTFCIYDGPDEESVRRAAERNELPIDSVTPVTVLDPYFYQ
jgi:predicted amidohydrolase YtcJ